MKIRGEFIATLSALPSTQEKMVTILWVPESEDISQTNLGMHVALAKANELPAWTEAIEQWNRGRSATNFSFAKYSILVESATKLLSKLIMEEAGGN